MYVGVYRFIMLVLIRRGLNKSKYSFNTSLQFSVINNLIKL